MNSKYTNLRRFVLAALVATVSSVGLVAADLKISSPAFADKGQMPASRRR